MPMPCGLWQKPHPGMAQLRTLPPPGKMACQVSGWQRRICVRGSQEVGGNPSRNVHRINNPFNQKQMNHKFPYRWTLKDARFTKDKGKVFSCFACGGGQQWAIN